MAEKTKAPYTFLSDEKFQLIDYFGVRHQGGGPKGDIARSASFLIDQNGIVQWEFITDNYRVRPNPKQILAEVDRLMAE